MDWWPDDAVEYSFYKPGFAGATVGITADDSEHVQTIHPVLHITGKVTDAVSGRPIDDFLAVPVIFFRPDFPMLERTHAKRQQTGNLALEFDRTDIEHGVQVERRGMWRFAHPVAIKSARLLPRWIFNSNLSSGRLGTSSIDKAVQ